jgi:hypothetical protein
MDTFGENDFDYIVDSGSSAAETNQGIKGGFVMSNNTKT